VLPANQIRSGPQLRLNIAVALPQLTQNGVSDIIPADGKNAESLDSCPSRQPKSTLVERLRQAIPRQQFEASLDAFRALLEIK
jgi:hypothetical protein